jgi:hypothetical protein
MCSFMAISPGEGRPPIHRCALRIVNLRQLLCNAARYGHKVCLQQLHTMVHATGCQWRCQEEFAGELLICVRFSYTRLFIALESVFVDFGLHLAQLAIQRVAGNAQQRGRLAPIAARNPQRALDGHVLQLFQAERLV